MGERRIGRGRDIERRIRRGRDREREEQDGGKIESCRKRKREGEREST